MAWTSIVVVSTGELATAATHNDQVLGNLNELRTGGLAIASQAVGDILKATSASQWGRLAIGTTGQALIVSGGVPAWGSVSGGGLGICEGRLTATSGTPVTTADVTGATSIYFSPYKGNSIALYDGAAWNVRTFTEITISLAAFTASKPYDIFAYDNAGTVTIETLVWTDGTTRATALALQNGVLSKTGALTRRYLGTVYINSSGGQTDDAVLTRYVWNYYNRVPRFMRAVDTTNSWAYATPTWRQANAAAANKLQFVLGYAEELLDAEITTSTDGSGNARVAIGLDSTSAPTAGKVNATSLATSGQLPVVGSLKVYPTVGYHYAAWLEYSSGGATVWYGDDGGTIAQSGISGVING